MVQAELWPGNRVVWAICMRLLQLSEGLVMCGGEALIVKVEEESKTSEVGSEWGDFLIEH